MFSYKRWRHTHGFGVHSPFAYDLVKNVVKPGRRYAWYGYADIEAAAAAERLPRTAEKEARMFLRLLCRLQPESLFLPKGISQAFHAAARAASSKMRIERLPKRAAECRMIASHGEFIPLDVLRKHLQTPGNVVVLRGYPEGWERSLFESLPDGLMIQSRRNLFIISREEMRKISYDMML